jgi:hypothetical protein
MRIYLLLVKSLTLTSILSGASKSIRRVNCMYNEPHNTVDEARSHSYWNCPSVNALALHDMISPLTLFLDKLDISWLD